MLRPQSVKTIINRSPALSGLRHHNVKTIINRSPALSGLRHHNVKTIIDRSPASAGPRHQNEKKIIDQNAYQIAFPNKRPKNQMKPNKILSIKNMKNIFSLFVILLLISAAANAQIPTITSFTPTSGVIGTSVIITGTNFNTTPVNNIVYFGSTKATVNSATAISLTVTVPSGAIYGPITVTTNNRTAYSSLPFVVTFFSNRYIDPNSFSPKVDFSTGTGAPRNFVITDIDGDGKPDFAVSYGSNEVALYRNLGNSGGFTTNSFARIMYGIGIGPWGIAAGDLDGDGLKDLAIGNADGGTVTIIRNGSSPGSFNFFTSPDLNVGAPFSSYPYSVVIGDVDGDGKPEVITANWGLSTISIFPNTSTVGNISFGAKIDFPVGLNPYPVAIGDIDRDGKTDIVVSNSGSNTVSVFRNNSSPSAISLNPGVNFNVLGADPRALAIGDFDGDGKPELVTGNVQSNNISILRNTSTPGIINASSFALAFNFTSGIYPYNISLGDINGDGKTDIAVANSSSSSASIFRNTSTPGIINASSFAQKVDFNLGTSASPSGIIVGDLDGDSRPDFITANSGLSTISLFHNQGSGLERDSLALVDMYNNMNGSKWPKKNHWLTGKLSLSDVDTSQQWYGIYLTNYGNGLKRVTEVNLYSDSLSGSIHPSIGNLDSLNFLQFGYNRLGGAIPDTLYHLRNLTGLSLYGQIYINYNNPNTGFSGSISPRITKLKRLNWFDLSGNRLTGSIPTQLDSLTFLNQISLGGNQLTGSIPLKIWSMPSLYYLYLGSNNFSPGTLPASITAPLYNLDVGYCSLSGAIPTLPPNLNYLNLAGNQYSGTIPPQITSATNLYSLSLGNNQFTSVPVPSFSSLTKLQDLDLSNNQFNQPFPVEILADSMYSLYLSNAKFTGAVPAKFATLRKLQYVYLDNNQLTSLPVLNVTTIPNFQYLRMESNRFTFKDIVPNIPVIKSYFGYSPQDSVGVRADTSALSGASVTVRVPTSVLYSGNLYQWRRNGGIVAGATSSTYTFTLGTLTAGGYTCDITNPGASGLTLRSRLNNVTINAPPSAPSGLTATAGNRQVTLKWRKNTESDVTKYRIYWDVNPNPSFQKDSTITLTDTTKIITGLTNRITYYFRLKAVDNLGQPSSSYSSPVNAVPLDLVPPTAPTSLTGYPGNQEVKLSWNLNPEIDVARYVIYRSTINNFTPTPADSVGRVGLNPNAVDNGNNHLDLNLTNGTTYYYKIVAVDSSENKSTPGSQVSALPSGSIPTWYGQGIPSGYNLYSVQFINSTNGWVGTATGKILHTTTGGQTWTVQNTGTVDPILTLFFVNASEGWAANVTGTILHTVDGGNSWQIQTSGYGTFRSIFFLDASNGWASHSFGLLRTINGGINWIPATTPPVSLMRNITFTDVNNGWAGRYGSPTIYKSTNGGDTWTLLANLSLVFPGRSLILRNFEMVTPFVGYAAGFDNTGNYRKIFVAKTNDGGNSWSEITPFGVGEVRGLDFIDANNGRITTTSGYIFNTTDGGTNWQYQSTRSNGFLYSVSMVSPGLGWAVDFGGAVYKLNTSPTGNLAPTVAVNTPTSSDTLWGGRRNTITWTANDDNGIASVVVQYSSTGNAPYTQLAQILANNGKYDWLTPESEFTNNGIVQIQVFDAQGLSATAQSQIFHILPNGIYTHNTGTVAYTFGNDGTQGTGQLGYYKPSLEIPVGSGQNLDYAGTLMFGYVRPGGSPGDTVGISNLYDPGNFKPLNSIVVNDYGSYKETITTYRDNLGAGIQVQQKTVASNGDNFIIFDYTITNRSSQRIDSLYLGNYHDFDISATHFSNNKAGYDGTRRLAYMFDATNPNGPYPGMRMLDVAPKTFKRIDFGIYPLPSNPTAMWQAMARGGIDNTSSDPTGEYAIMEAKGPFTIPVNQTTRVTFAILAAYGLPNLQTVSDNAQLFWTLYKVLPPQLGTLTAQSTVDIISTQNIPVQIMITDTDNGINQVNLYYKKGGDTNYTSTPMSLTSGTNLNGQWQANIPSNFINLRGIEFYIEAISNNLGKTSRTANTSVRVVFSNGLANTDPNNNQPVFQPAGNTVDKYRLFAVPVVLTDNSTQGFVNANPDLGPYDPKVWRWADFSRSSRQFVEYPNFTQVLPDHGYLMIVNKQNVQLNVGPGTTITTTQPYTINLPQGWSVVGNPFTYDIPKDSISVSAGTYELWTYNGSWTQNTVTGFKAWEGYALYLTQPALLTIRPGRFGLSKENNPFNLATADKKNWFIQITAKLKDTEDVFNYVGQNEKASNKYDVFDLHKPPSIGEDVRLQIYHPDWTTQTTEAFATDVHQLNAEGQFFDFTLVTKAEDGIGKLTFEGIQNVPPEFLVYLVDKVSGASTDLRKNKESSFAPALSGKKEYRLLAGTKDFVERNSAGANLFPTEYKLAQNYPNPFNPTTTIQYAVPQTGPVKLEIFNVLGQRVKTLVDENQTVSNYTAIWDSKNDHGIAMPSGVYFYRIIAGKFVQTKKMVLMK